MRFSRAWTTLLALAFGGAVGCTSGYDSGAPDDKQASDLEPAEAQTACESYVAYIDAKIGAAERAERACVFRALFRTTSPEDCEANVTSCLADPPPDGFDVDCSDPFVSPFCQATIGQVEACVTADTEIYLDYVRAPTCAAAGNLPELERLLAVPPPPMECEILRSVCPSLGDGFYGGR